MKGKMMSETIDEMSAFIRARHDLPDDWNIYFLRVVGADGGVGTHALPIEVTGARHAVTTRGDRKGQPNWRKRLDKPRTFVIMPGDLEKEITP